MAKKLVPIVIALLLIFILLDPSISETNNIWRKISQAISKISKKNEDNNDIKHTNNYVPIRIPLDSMEILKGIDSIESASHKR